MNERKGDNMIKKIQNEWNKHGCFYRTVRTFIQVFLGTISGYIMQMMNDDIAVSTVIGMAVATALCAAMNIDYDERQVDENDN